MSDILTEQHTIDSILRSQIFYFLTTVVSYYCFDLEIVKVNLILHQKIHATCLIVKKLDSTA